MHIALVLGGLALAVYLLAMVLLGGCAGLPPEPGYTVTHARDAGR